MKLEIDKTEENEEKLKSIKNDFKDKIKHKNTIKYYDENDEEILDLLIVKDMHDKGIKPKSKNYIIISFNNNDVLDKTEIEIYNRFNKDFDKFKIIIFSKRFIDLHKVTKTKTFQKAYKEITKKIKPMYIKEKEKYYWIGIENFTDKIDITKTIKEIYRIGCGMCLIPSDLVIDKE